MLRDNERISVEKAENGYVLYLSNYDIAEPREWILQKVFVFQDRMGLFEKLVELFGVGSYVLEKF